MTHQDPWDVTDPDQTLTEILRRSGARESDVVIARLDCSSQVVTGLHRVRGGVAWGHRGGCRQRASPGVEPAVPCDRRTTRFPAGIRRWAVERTPLGC